MKKLRHLAIQQLSSRTLDPIDKVVLTRRYHVKGWLRPALTEIIQRAQSPTIHDFEQLEMDFPEAVELFGMREIHLRYNHSGYYHGGSNAHFQTRFEAAFGREITEVDRLADAWNEV